MQRNVANSTQSAVHEVVQHVGDVPQTSCVHALQLMSRGPPSTQGPWLHWPHAPQSVAQVWQLSVAEQVPSPHVPPHGPQSVAQDEHDSPAPHAPSPQNPPLHEIPQTEVT